MRLLLAEPTKAIGELINFICEQQGVECDIARDVESLFLFLNEEQYDVICLAPNIDAADGIDVLVRIRAIEVFSYIPIFLITSSNNPDLVRRALSVGATDIIDKADFEGLQFFIQRFKRAEQPIKANVLVIEDTLSQQSLLTSLLESVGCVVECFDNAEEAFTRFQQFDFDLVITDILLKGDLSGVALAGRIRRLKSINGDVPIIAITGFDEHSRQESLYHYGVSDYLTKPIDGSRFCHKVRNLIKSYKNYKKLELKKVALLASDIQRVQFWRNMSQELSAPVNNIVGSLQLVNLDDVHAAKRIYLDNAKKSSESLLTMINDVLDLTESVKGEPKFINQKIDIKQSIEQALSRVQGKADEKGLLLNYLILNDVPEYIESDVNRFNQILYSLLHNAIRYTHQGSVKLKCELDSNIKFLKISVVDTGIGLNELEKIYVLYKSKKDVRKNDIGKSNIGDDKDDNAVALHISKMIINLLGGNLGVNSIYGQGSEFWFRLPIQSVINNEE